MAGPDDNRRGDDDESHRSGLHRENVPGELEHASGQEEEFEAAIVRGADGEEGDVDDAALEEAALAASPSARRSTGAAGAPTAHQAAGAHGGPRVIGFFRACWAELQRVQWPDRRQVGQATAVVLGFVVVAGAYLGAADALAKKVIDIIL